MTLIRSQTFGRVPKFLANATPPRVVDHGAANVLSATMAASAVSVVASRVPSARRMMLGAASRSSRLACCELSPAAW